MENGELEDEGMDWQLSNSMAGNSECCHTCLIAAVVH